MNEGKESGISNDIMEVIQKTKELSAAVGSCPRVLSACCYGLLDTVEVSSLCQEGPEGIEFTEVIRRIDENYVLLGAEVDGVRVTMVKADKEGK